MLLKGAVKEVHNSQSDSDLSTIFNLRIRKWGHSVNGKPKRVSRELFQRTTMVLQLHKLWIKRFRGVRERVTTLKYSKRISSSYVCMQLITIKDQPKD